jgi:hypothetical protein
MLCLKSDLKQSKTHIQVKEAIMNIQQFAYPIARYRGENDSSSQEFNAQFQNFAHRVSILCALHTGGKISTSQTYQHMLTLYEQLQPYLSLIADSSPCDLSNGFAASHYSDDGTLHNT